MSSTQIERLSVLATEWFEKACDAYQRKDSRSHTVAKLAHDMCRAAFQNARAKRVDMG